MIACLENPIKRYLAYWHGAPTDPQRQYAYYRCECCRGVVTWKQIAAGGCKCGTGSRIRPAYLSVGEKLKLLCIPWSM